MMKEKMTIDDLLKRQEYPSFVVTVEAVADKPDLVKITPWLESAGCLCHLSLQVAKSSLEGATPTGQIHMCCGKTLQVVKLHFKSGESIGVEEVLRQLQASAAESVFSHEGAPAVPAHAPGPPPAIPPPWGPGWPPWFTGPWRPDHSLRHSQRFTELSRYPRALCEANHDRCLENCSHSYDPARCNCLCGSSYALCAGYRPYEC